MMIRAITALARAAETSVHVTRCVRWGLAYPRLMLDGVREFRSDFTASPDTIDQLLSYDAGRELAHLATLRTYDTNAPGQHKGGRK